MEKEEWRNIDEFPDYKISNFGRVMNNKTGYIKKPSIGKRGYYVYSMQKDGKSYLRTTHIMLARSFIPNPQNLEQINHIDGNKLNCSIENLEWVSPRDNMLHARKMGLHKSDGDKETAQYSLDGNQLINVYKSASEAARQTGLSRSNICSVARGNTREKSCGGYIWRYINE